MSGAPVKFTLEVSRDGRTGGLQLSINDVYEHGGGTGYRLAGPKFSGSGEVLMSHALTSRDVGELRRWLDRAEPMAREWKPSDVVRAVEALLDDADQGADTLRKPNRIAVWGVRRALMPFGGKPHRWPVPAERCAECDHRAYDHDEDCTWDDCDCALSDREAMWGRDESLDDSITQAAWEDAVSTGEPWVTQDAAAVRAAATEEQNSPEKA